MALDDGEEDVEAEGPLSPRSSTREERSEVAVNECDCLVGESGGTVVMVARLNISISTTNAHVMRFNGTKRGETMVQP